MAGRRRTIAAFLVVICAAGAGVAVCLAASGAAEPKALPKPNTRGTMSLEQALAKRRSVRRFKAERLTDQQIAQLCWAAQGVTEPRRGLRTAPSAGALYPLELYVVTPDGVRRYRPRRHALEIVRAGDVRGALQKAALGQRCVGEAAAVFALAAVSSRTAKKYGRRAERYVLLEAGHAAQNLLLEATALGLGAVPVGAFGDKQVAAVLSLPTGCAAVYLVPVGVPAE